MDEKKLTDRDISARLGVSSELIRLWRTGERRVTAERAIELFREVGVPPGDLRPDLWGPGLPPPAEPTPRRARGRSRQNA